ncbi:hypothetical protein Tco_1498813 [Tanacetum coccineum]
MSRSTISYESLAESLADNIGSSVSSVALPYLAPAIDSESEPFEDPKSPVASDHDFVEPLFDSELFIDHVSPTISAALDPDDEPLAQAAPAIAPESTPVLSPPIAPYRPGKTVQGPRKTVRPQPPLPPSILARVDNWIAAYPSSPPPSPAHSGPSRKRPRSSPSSSAGSPPKRCRESPAPASPTLHSVPVELLPPRKRFTTSERIETLEREVVSLTARLAAVEIQIDAL